MKKKDAISLKEAMFNFFEENETLKIGLAERKTINAWNELFGEGVAHYTKKIYLQKNILYVHLSSSVLRAELLMSKQNLIDKLNETAGMEVVKDIVLR